MRSSGKPDKPVFRLLTNEDSEPFLPHDDKGDISKQGIRGALFWLFAIALLLRLWFCFFHSHVNAYAGFDAVGYINAAKAIFELNTLPASFAKDCLQTLRGSASAAVVTDVHNKLTMLEPLMISGPSYPIFLVLSTVLTNSPYNPTDWVKPVAAQCMISAVTVVFITAIARQLFDRKTGVLAGAMAALYPPFIINCGRGCTETFATFLLCLFSYGFLHLAQSNSRAEAGKSSPKRELAQLIIAAIFLGALAACLELARTILLLLTALAVAMIVIRLKGKMRVAAIASFFVGFALIIVPWFAAQKLIVGRTSLVIDRVSRLNYGLGNQAETQGWAGFPLQFKPIMDRSINVQTIEYLSKDPAGYVWLLQDKLPRLLKCGWNDFKTWLGLLSPPAQDVLHQFVIAFAVAGIILCLDGCEEGTYKWRSRVTGVLYFLIVLAVHLPYLAFVTVGRYNLTAMPFLIVFSAWGLRRLRQLGNWNAGSSDVLELAYPSIYLLFAIFVLSDPTTMLVNAFGERGAAEIGIMTTIGLKSILFFFVVGLTYALINKTQRGFYSRSLTNLILTGLAILSFSAVCLPVRAHGRWYERPDTFTKQGDGITFELFAPPAVAKQAREGNAYLMVDAENLDSLTNGLSISIDGKTLTGPYIPGLSLLDDQNHFERRGNQLTRVVECLFESFSNVIGVGNNDIRQWFLIAIPPDSGPSLMAGSGADEQNKNSMRITIKRTEPGRTRLFKALTRDDGELTVPEWLYYSWDKAFYGVERRGGVCDPRTDRKIDAHKGDSGHFVRLLVPAPALSKTKPFTTLTFMEAHEIDVVPNKSLTNQTYKTLTLSPLPDYSDNDMWLLRVSGRYKTVGKLPAAVEILPKSKEKGEEFYYNAPWAPRFLQPSTQWRHFDAACPIKPQSFPGRMNRIDIKLHVLTPILNELTRPVESDEIVASSCQFDDIRVEIVSLPSNPLAEKHQVF